VLVREHDLLREKFFHYILKAILPRTFPSEKQNTLFLKINGLGNLGKCSFTEILGPIL
jgi:hypothetical protein